MWPTVALFGMLMYLLMSAVMYIAASIRMVQWNSLQWLVNSEWPTFPSIAIADANHMREWYLLCYHLKKVTCTTSRHHRIGDFSLRNIWGIKWTKRRDMSLHDLVSAKNHVENMVAASPLTAKATMSSSCSDAFILSLCWNSPWK